MKDVDMEDVDCPLEEAANEIAAREARKISTITDFESPILWRGTMFLHINWG